jgi:hypothetical protein
MIRLNGKTVKITTTVAGVPSMPPPPRGAPVKLVAYLVTRQAMKSEANTRSTLRLTFMPLFPIPEQLALQRNLSANS